MIGIVGGGISGLAVAHFLAETGSDFVLLESDAEPGGVMRTHRVEGYPLDTGPQRTRVTDAVAGLIEAAGLGDRMVVAPRKLPLFVYRRGKLREVPMAFGAAVRTDLLDWTGKLRVLLEPLTAGPRDEETVERYLTRSFGRQAYERMLGPFYGGLYGSDPARMRVRHGLRSTLDHFGVHGSLLVAFLRRGAKARESVRTVSFEGGMQALAQGLATRYADRIRLGTRVTAIRRHGNGQFALEVDGDGPIGVDRVVLSLPAPEAATALAELAPEASKRIGRLRYNRLAVVHMIAAGEGETLRGAGYQVAFDESMETRGVTWNGALFGRGGLCAAYLGGMRNPELVEWDDHRIAEVALREFREVTGLEARLLGVSRTWIPAWDLTWDALTDLELPAGIDLCANWSARPGIPGRVAAARRVAEELEGGS